MELENLKITSDLPTAVKEALQGSPRGRWSPTKRALLELLEQYGTLCFDEIVVGLWRHYKHQVPKQTLRNLLMRLCKRNVIVRLEKGVAPPRYSLP